MKFRPSMLAGASLMLHAAAAAAQIEIPDNARVPGIAIVNVVSNTHGVEIAFVLTGIDAVGFEHAPRSDAEQARIDETMQTLETPDAWLVPEAAAKCRRVFGAVAPHRYRTAEAHEGASGADAAQPAEIGVQYSFRCDEPQRLHTLSFDLIARFPRLHAVVVNLIGAGGRSQQLLSTAQAQIVFAAAPTR